MEPRLSLESLSFAVPGRAEEKPEEKRSPFEASIRDKLEFWAENVPSKDDYSFQSLIQRQSGAADPQDPVRRPFEPKDQHCGIWKDAPNKQCHASFGDQGTTASVSCYGDLIQMSQFLGVGHSGVFTIDHRSIDKPYYIVGRADDLSDLAKEGFGGGNLSFGLNLPREFQPDQVPEMKWVNWKWPRHEWKVPDDSITAQVSSQWLVKNNTVFHQIVVTNTGISPIEGFRVQANRHMLIRDLDYLQGVDYNHDESESYIRGRGPNDFSWITANVIHDEDPTKDPANDLGVQHPRLSREVSRRGDGVQSPGVNEEVSENKRPNSSSNSSSVERTRAPTSYSQGSKERDLPSGDTPGAEDTNGNAKGIEEHKTVEQSQGRPLSENKCSPSDDEVWQNRRISDTESVKDAHAVVSIMSLYVNGTAEQMGTELPRIHQTIGAIGSNSNRLEITVAYKMIAIPKGKVHWKNFLIPAEAADVDAMLAAETEQLWGHSVIDDCKCRQSLCDIGLSMVNPSDLLNVGQDGSTLVGNSEQPKTSDQDAQKGLEVPEITTANANARIDAKGGETTMTPGSPNEHNADQDQIARPVADGTSGMLEQLSPIRSIEYLMWRHTEHILSVCVIPLSVSPLLHEDEVPGPTPTAPKLGTSSGKENEHEVPLALTCGDISGHRICTSASFFAFEFLVDVLRRLPFVEQTPYIILLQQRINDVCRGHIRWLEWVRKPWLTLADTKSLLGSGCFAANYWVNGSITPYGGGSWQPDDAITDTPFHVLKVTKYVKWLRMRNNLKSLEDQQLRHHMALLRDIWVCWIHELDDLDKRKACAWPHTSEDGLNTYRLDDHFWLWNSLKELHDLDLWSLTDAGGKSWRDSRGRWIPNIYSLSPEAKLDGLKPTNTSETSPDPEALAEFSSVARRLSPKEVQRAVLQRFTVENDVSQERMLAVTRSARDTRFFFHARDTALFYGHAKGFFRPDTSFSELWERTIKSQSRHEEPLDERWETPLRIALKAMAGLHDFSVDKKSPFESIKSSLEVIVQASAHNAFIPGGIDATTREPSIFDEEADRDYYYHVGFEVCHILLACARDIDAAFRSEPNRAHSPAALAKQAEDNSRQVQREAMEILLNEMMTQPKKQKMATHQNVYDYGMMTKLVGADSRLDRKRTSVAMKRIMPFNNMIDTSSIVPLEEEWLYNYPDFLMIKKINLQEELKRLLKERSYQSMYRPVYQSPSSIVDKELESLKKTPPEEFRFTLFKRDHYPYDGVVASLPKQKNRRQKRRKRDIGASVNDLPKPDINEMLWDSIGEARSATKAKKRFLWLPASSNSQTALLCWLASSEAEKPAMSLFFDRHAEYDNHLWDDTTMVLNSWQTELHMCFWLIYEKSQPLLDGLPQPIIAPWPRGSDKELRRASMGFRFDGDFFDRYWTCHFIQYVPGLTMGYLGIPEGWFGMFYNEKHAWQRKVMELQLLQHMLDLILTASNRILKDIETDLGLKKGNFIFFVLTTEAYSSSEDHWQIYEELLQKAEEDITSSLNTLSKWATRESDRGQERPRWTRNDERKYRGYINKLHSHTERQRWDLESCRDKMCKLRDTLATTQNKIRADLEANREQNIRYFTYVTVIFLPLGFASSFYSMNGAPSNDLIVSLAKFAAAAFVVTAFLVFGVSVFMAAGAKALSVVKEAASVAKDDMVGPLRQHTLDIRKKSSLVTRTSSDDELDKTRTLHEAYSKKDWMVTSWFWPAYVLLELPTRAVSSAWTALGTGDLSAGAVWRVALGIIALPIYAISRAVLISFGNAVIMLRISKHLFQLSVGGLSTKQASDGSHTPGKKVAGGRSPDEKTRPTDPSSKEAPEKTGDAESIPGGKQTLPDHFKQLMPTPEPLHLLQSLDHKLTERKLKVQEGKSISGG